MYSAAADPTPACPPSRETSAGVISMTTTQVTAPHPAATA